MVLFNENEIFNFNLTLRLQGQGSGGSLSAMIILNAAIIVSQTVGDSPGAIWISVLCSLTFQVILGRMHSLLTNRDDHLKVLSLFYNA